MFWRKGRAGEPMVCASGKGDMSLPGAARALSARQTGVWWTWEAINQECDWRTVRIHHTSDPCAVNAIWDISQEWWCLWFTTLHVVEQRSHKQQVWLGIAAVVTARVRWHIQGTGKSIKWDLVFILQRARWLPSAPGLMSLAAGSPWRCFPLVAFFPK